MFRLFTSLFSSPETLLQVLSRSDIEESIADGERIIIDEDGNAAVNVLSDEAQVDFDNHVNALKRT
ncbi:hypothetical protein N5923_09360 [Erwiniaceae bacterium BAC15a-03b]|uniref:Uncharacterized protein n=1 Tax=Winslowiella arboricola TaxID=2978220 RepID=A0A9J6PMQ3_9GAMM|nr:hypothetical protein [Winslowiella arboricola]MCU5773789.1 hypothetical protein [Winslowiella arboricola]MCU5777699.1 hypothetical protein [Winslowiella arboricola]